jgi:hypothetical protein
MGSNHDVEHALRAYDRILAHGEPEQRFVKDETTRLARLPSVTDEEIAEVIERVAVDGVFQDDAGGWKIAPSLHRAAASAWMADPKGLPAIVANDLWSWAKACAHMPKWGCAPLLPIQHKPLKNSTAVRLVVALRWALEEIEQPNRTQTHGRILAAGIEALADVPRSIHEAANVLEDSI